VVGTVQAVRTMQAKLSQAGILKAFHEIVGFVRRTRDARQLFTGTVDAVGQSFGLDRCMLLIVDAEAREIEIRAEYAGDGLAPLGLRRYGLASTSEWYRLLAEGRPVPLKEIQPQGAGQRGGPDFSRFVEDSDSKSLVAFPLVADGRLLGCLTLHQCLEPKPLSDELLEIGEILSEELAAAVKESRITAERDVQGRVFIDCELPMLLVEAETCRIARANDASRQLLAGGRESVEGLSFPELFADSDGRRLREAGRSLRGRPGPVVLPGLYARTTAGASLHLDVCLSGFGGETESILVTLTPSPPHDGAGGQRSQANAVEKERIAKIEELVATISKQLNWERIARHIIAAVHASLDRDMLLQTAVDSLGRALVASRCLIVRTDGPASPTVTHEYVQPDISPLGLGRTSQFPLAAISCFKGKAVSFADISAETKRQELTYNDITSLIEGGIHAIAGTPISHHGNVHGVILVLQNDHPRQWTAPEMELIEAVSSQVAIALNHAQAYAQIKDQLFNMNLIGNLTQQLTNALDLSTRAARPAPADDSGKQPGALPPLSLRELEVLKLIASGLANREIAQRLFLTESTVELHASRIRKKLKLKSRTALVKYACDHHLV